MGYSVIGLFSKESKILFLKDQLKENCLVTRFLLFIKFSQY